MIGGFDEDLAVAQGELADAVESYSPARAVAEAHVGGEDLVGERRRDVADGLILVGRGPRIDAGADAGEAGADVDADAADAADAVAAVE